MNFQRFVSGLANEDLFMVNPHTYWLAMVYLGYCSSVFTGSDARTRSFIQVAQNACARFILDLPRRSSVSSHRRALGFLCPRDAVLVESLVLLHKVVHRSWPPTLMGTLALVSCDEFRRGRSAATGCIVLPRARTSTSTRCRFTVINEKCIIPADQKSQMSFLCYISISSWQASC